MAATGIDLQRFVAALRRSIGSPAEVELTSSDLENYVRRAVRRVLRALPKTGRDAKLGSFTTVASQQTYPVPDDQLVLEIFWGPSYGDTETAGGVAEDPFPNIPQRSSGMSAVGSYWRSDAVIDAMKAQQIADQWHGEVLDGNFYLDPVPTEDGLTVRYLYRSTAGDLRELTVEHERGLQYAAAADCLRHLANMRRGKQVAITREGLNASQTPTELDQTADRYDDLFRQEMSELSDGPR